MRKVFLISLIFSLTLCSCKGNEKEVKSTPVATDAVTEITTDSVEEVESPDVLHDIPETTEPEETSFDTTVTEEATNPPIQQEGTISIEEATSLLRTYLGSFDENGNEFIFGYENTINKDGVEYYNFRITTLIFDESGTVHQSYYGNYIISTDGIELEEYFPQP